MTRGGADVVIREIKCTTHVMHLNHPETNPPRPTPPVHGKVVFHETCPWCQKGWGLWFYITEALFVCLFSFFFFFILTVSVKTADIWYPGVLERRGCGKVYLSKAY